MRALLRAADHLTSRRALDALAPQVKDLITAGDFFDLSESA